MVGFKNENINPRKRKTTDCVIRAITTATSMEYSQVLLGLADIHIKTGYHMSDKKNYEKFLNNLGWIKHKQPRKLDGTKYLVGEINQLVRPNQRAIISLAGHLTAKIENEIIDTWDCRHKTIGNYYTHPKDEYEY